MPLSLPEILAIVSPVRPRALSMESVLRGGLMFGIIADDYKDRGPVGAQG